MNIDETIAALDNVIAQQKPSGSSVEYHSFLSNGVRFHYDDEKYIYLDFYYSENPDATKQEYNNHCTLDYNYIKTLKDFIAQIIIRNVQREMGITNLDLDLDLTFNYKHSDVSFKERNDDIEVLYYKSHIATLLYKDLRKLRLWLIDILMSIVKTQLVQSKEISPSYGIKLNEDTLEIFYYDTPYQSMTYAIPKDQWEITNLVNFINRMKECKTDVERLKNEQQQAV